MVEVIDIPLEISFSAATSSHFISRGSQSVVPGPRTSASPGKLEMQLLRSEPELLNQTLQGWGPAYVFEQALEVMLG